MEMDTAAAAADAQSKAIAAPEGEQDGKSADAVEANEPTAQVADASEPALELPAEPKPEQQEAGATAASESAAGPDGHAPDGVQQESDAAEDEPSASAQPGLIGRITGTVSEKVHQVAEKAQQNERLQHGMDLIRQKTRDVMENERVQKGMEYVKDTTKAVSEKVTETSKAWREGATSVWGKGRGQILRVREEVSKVAWRGSAKETLAMREEQWKDIKNLKAEEMSVPARTEHTTVYHVQAGSMLRWTFRVKDHDIGFGVRVRIQDMGGSREESVLDVERYDCNDTISGSWVADENRTMVLVFDNKYSKLRSKTIAYLVGTEKLWQDPPASAPAAAAEDVDAAPAAEAAAAP